MCTRTAVLQLMPVDYGIPTPTSCSLRTIQWENEGTPRKCCQEPTLLATNVMTTDGPQLLIRPALTALSRDWNVEESSSGQNVTSTTSNHGFTTKTVWLDPHQSMIHICKRSRCIYICHSCIPLCHTFGHLCLSRNKMRVFS